jgi:hypothetical protein
MAKRKVIPVAKLKAGERPTVFDLPAHVNEGIGKLIMTNAILETQISELMYDLAKIDYPAGRVSFGYRNAADRFKTIIELIEMRGIKPSIDLNKLKKRIDKCCVARDIFAHNVWVKEGDKNLIRQAKGTLETPEGKHNFKYMPHGQMVPDGYFANTVQAIKATIGNVLELKSQVIAELKSDQKPEE